MTPSTTSLHMTEAEVREKFEGFVQALKAGDLESLERIYSEDYVLVRPDGTTLTKKEILEDLKRHSMLFTSFETAQVRIKTAGPVGVLTMKARSAFLRDGQQGQTYAQQVVVFFKTGEDIRITHFQSTNIVS